MKYANDYITTHDIDWFFLLQIGEKAYPIHIASRGYKLPDFVNDLYKNRNLQHEVSFLDEDYNEEEMPNDIEINENALNELTQLVKESLENDNLEGIEYDPQIFRKEYLKTFSYMAHVGFFSFDTFKESYVEGIYRPPYYRLIAKPMNGKTIGENVMKLLPFDIDFSNSFATKLLESQNKDNFLIE